MIMRNLFILLIVCSAVFSCSGKKSDSKGDPYGVEKRERERNANAEYKQRMLDQEIKKLLRESNEPVKESKSVRSKSLTPDDAYSIGYENGYQQGLEDKESGQSFEANYDDSNDFYKYYNTRYCEGYEDGYNIGYEEGEVEIEGEVD